MAVTGDRTKQICNQTIRCDNGLKFNSMGSTGTVYNPLKVNWAVRSAKCRVDKAPNTTPIAMSISILNEPAVEFESMLENLWVTQI